MFSDWLRRLNPCLSNSVGAYKRDFFRNIASENIRETLSVRNAFSYVDVGRVRGFELMRLVPQCVLRFVHIVDARTF